MPARCSAGSCSCPLGLVRPAGGRHRRSLADVHELLGVSNEVGVHSDGQARLTVAHTRIIRRLVARQGDDTPAVATSSSGAGKSWPSGSPLYDVVSTIALELTDSAGQPMQADTHLSPVRRLASGATRPQAVISAMSRVAEGSGQPGLGAVVQRPLLDSAASRSRSVSSLIRVSCSRAKSSSVLFRTSV
jgi:hypothetical protein